MKALPKRLKIGYFTINIVYTHGLVDDEDRECMGLSDTDKQIMYINIDYPDQVIKETLLHEAMHFLVSDTFIFPDEEIEENVIRLMSPKTIELLARNKTFTKFIISKNTGEVYEFKDTEKGEDREESGRCCKESGTGSKEGNKGSKEGNKGSKERSKKRS